MHRRHAAASLVALVFACSVQLGKCVLSFQHQLPAELQGLRSNYTCAPLEAGQHPDHRVCFFKNLLVFNGSLVYLGPDARSIPTINTEYWLGGELQDWLTNFTSIDLLEPRPQHVVTINKAVLTDWPFYHNYFHVFAEYLPSLHNVLCKYWNDCTFDPHTDLDILLLTPGISSNHSRDAVSTDAARCMTAKPISAISTTVNNTHTAVLIKDAIAGWGPECRADHWHCLPWKYRRPPSTEIMELWRQRVGDCIGFDWDRSVQSSPPTIVVIDRQWNASRHIININHVMATLESNYPRAQVELHYLEGLNLKQQAMIYNRASIVLWVHGASMANLIFLPRRAVGLHIVPRPHIQENLDWPEELVRDLSHEVKLIHINNTGPDLLPLKTSRITLDWTYRGLNETEKLAIWEEGECLDSLKRPMDENDTSTSPDTVHHYCEEFWFKTNTDIVLNMTAVIPVIDSLFQDYFPSLPGDSQVVPAHIKGHVGLTKMIPQSGSVPSKVKQSSHGHR
ncbi:hypothetical protein ABBQ32_001476 [Trebouxia sp. C0010 RCD-2024]